MKLIFLGSGEFGLPTLMRFHERHQVVAVVSQPDKPAGRHRKLTPTPIAAWAEQAKLKVAKTDNVNTPEFVEEMRRLGADAAVVIAFGQKLGEPLIAALGRLAVNLHASLLPKYRGAAPINWAIIHGDHETGVSVIALSQRMDAGMIYAQASTPINPHETAGELHDRLAALGPAQVEKVLEEFERGTLKGRAQDEAHATKAPKLSKADAHVSFEATADQVRRRIHGLTPWPGVHVKWQRTSDGHVQDLAILRAEAEHDLLHDAPLGTVLEEQRVAVRDGAVHLLEVQIAGGRAMSAEEFARGHKLAPGDTLKGS